MVEAMREMRAPSACATACGGCGALLACSSMPDTSSDGCSSSALMGFLASSVRMWLAVWAVSAQAAGLQRGAVRGRSRQGAAAQKRE